MRLTTCLFWYAEDLAELWAQVTALEGFADRLVAVNGRWSDGEGHEFPKPERDTTREEIATVVEAAETAGIDVTVHRPAGTWKGEVAQRNYTLQLALIDSDWIFLMDADERVTHVGDKVRDQLAKMREHAGSVRFYTLEGPEKLATLWETPGETTDQRRLFRALPGLRFETHHYWLRTDKLSLWVGLEGTRFVEHRKLDIDVEHRTCVRTAERWKAKREFMAVRDPADTARGWEH